MQPVTLRARAKLNLFLHILSRRADGYHTMESLVVFPELADALTIAPDAALTLSVGGEFAGDAGAENNLVMRAAHALQEVSGARHGAQLTLTKNIPVGAGLGGGSADAAAALKGLNAFWELGLSDAQLQAVALTLGADVAMCLASQPLIARGIGEEIELMPAPLPEMVVVLVHPRVPLLTADVYRAFSVGAAASAWSNDADIWQQLKQTRNHLQPAAIAVNPLVAELLLELETLQPAPELVRMTGSGACCFALYTQHAEAERAAESLRRSRPEWWVNVSRV